MTLTSVVEPLVCQEGTVNVRSQSDTLKKCHNTHSNIRTRAHFQFQTHTHMHTRTKMHAGISYCLVLLDANDK